jgi:hypothetical protein
MATGAPGKINDYSRLQIEALTTNQVVGSSNLSGRAIFQALSCTLAALSSSNVTLT